jgi:anti-sigma regulatory factor (Ser/Thr protein kinase)
METLETQLPSSNESPLLARAFLRATLETWKLDGFGKITELLTSELVSNVVVHVGEPMTVRITRQPSAIRVEVEDPSGELPELRHPGIDDEHGRGVLFVSKLAADWGAERTERGKTVWFEIDTSTATAEAHDR